MNNVDAFGTEFKVGDTIVYGVQDYGPRYLTKSVVTKITKAGVKHHPQGEDEQYGEYLKTCNFMVIR